MLAFTPLDVLYIVLAFCALWLTAALFWLMWQIGRILRTVEDTMEMAQEKISRIESAITSIKSRFEHITSASTLLIDGVKKALEYVNEWRTEIRAKSRPAVKRVRMTMDE